MNGYAPPKLRQIVAEAVFRRKRVVLTTIAVVCTLVLAASLAMHRKYQSTAKLLVQNVRTAAQLTTSNVDRLVSQGDVSPAEINTEVDLLQSEGVARRALRSSKPATNPERDESAVRSFGHLLSVEAVHQTNIIDVKMLGNSPEEAKRNLQHIIDSYFEERAGTARSSGAAEFFNSQLRDKTRQVNADQAALTAFEMQHGIADLDDQTKLQVTRLSALQDQLAQTQTNLAAQQSKAAAEKRQLSLTPNRSNTQVRTITNQYSQERLNTALVDLENRRTELLKRYVPSDRQVIEIDEKIATTQHAIKEASVHPAGEETSDINPVWQQLSALIATSGGEINGLAGQQAELKSQIAAAKRRLNELQESTATYGELRRKLQQSQTDYTLYAQRRDEARISEALDRQKLFDVAVLQGPVSSADPVRPRPLLYMASALTFAIFLGIALALYADLTGGQVHTPAQLDSWTGLRTVATFADETEGSAAVEANRLQYRRVLFSIRQALLQMPDYPGPGPLHRPEGQPGASLVANADAAPGGVCIAFTSASQGEGVSHLVRNLASEAARNASSRVAVLDTRSLLRHFESGSKLPTRFEQDAEHWTLANSESVHRPDAVVRRAGLHGHFSNDLRGLLQEARREFDMVLLDCPSLQSSTLAPELAPCVDGYVAVVAAGTVRRQNIEDLSSQLVGTRKPLLGYVLNRRDYPVPHWLHRMI